MTPNYISIFALLFCLSFAACKQDKPTQIVSQTTKKVKKKKAKKKKDTTVVSLQEDSLGAEAKSTIKKSTKKVKKKRKPNQEPKKEASKKAKKKVPVKEKVKKTTPPVKIKPATKPEQPKGYAAIRFDDAIYDFGYIEQDEVIKHKFYFTNTGTGLLNILNTSATCGCTSPSVPLMPIEPGKRGYIEVQFNSTGRLGNQSPEITVVSNTNPKISYLKLKGIVTTKLIDALPISDDSLKIDSIGDN